MQNYLCSRQQRISINGSFSDWTEVISGVPQGPTLDSLLFNIFLNDIFMLSAIFSIMRITAFCILLEKIRRNWIRRNLEIDFMILHQWFHENHMTLNPGKCHYMVISSRDLSHEIMLNDSKITSSNEKKTIRYLSRQQTKFWKLYRLPLQKRRPKNKCLGQAKELPYIRSKKLTT